MQAKLSLSLHNIDLKVIQSLLPITVVHFIAIILILSSSSWQCLLFLTFFFSETCFHIALSVIELSVTKDNLKLILLLSYLPDTSIMVECHHACFYTMLGLKAQALFISASTCHLSYIPQPLIMFHL